MSQPFVIEGKAAGHQNWVPLALEYRPLRKLLLIYRPNRRSKSDIRIRRLRPGESVEELEEVIRRF